MTKRSKTPSYVIELEARVTSADLHRIKKKQEICRFIYNACLGHVEKAWRGLQADPVRKSCLTELRRLNAIAKPTPQDKGCRIRVQQRLDKVAVQYGFTEFCLHEFAAKQKRHFHHAVGINEVQKIATRAWLTMQKKRHFVKSRANVYYFGGRVPRPRIALAAGHPRPWNMGGQARNCGANCSASRSSRNLMEPLNFSPLLTRHATVPGRR